MRRTVRPIDCQRVFDRRSNEVAVVLIIDSLSPLLLPRPVDECVIRVRRNDDLYAAALLDSLSIKALCLPSFTVRSHIFVERDAEALAYYVGKPGFTQDQ
jgi:hypothetical protein